MTVHLPIAKPLIDPQERVIRYLRISLTDRCNYRCTYCMPEEGVDLVPRRDILSFEEIERLATVFVDLGVRRIRLTGGEPTIRKRVVQLVSMLSRIDGLDALVMTTNGHRLPELADELAGAGLAGVNVSIDTLDRDRFSKLTRRGDLDRVVRGIDAAISAGLEVKLNAVALSGGRGDGDGVGTEDDIAELCDFAWGRGIVVRFIEHMPMSSGLVYTERRHLASDVIVRLIEGHFGEAVTRVGSAARDRGPARLFQLATTGRQFGVISAMSEHFCDTCNRVRLSPTGDLHTCLGFDDATPLRGLLRQNAPNSELIAAIRRSISAKRNGHRFEISGIGGPRKHMVSIGG